MMNLEKEHKQSSLMSKKKSELAEHIMWLEHNNNALYQTLNVQAENFLKMTRWIPVTERLPECEWGTETSALLYQHKETGTIEVGYYGRGGKLRDSYFRHYRNVSDGIDSRDVIAWMPLPEPYKTQNLAFADNDTVQPGLQSAT